MDLTVELAYNDQEELRPLFLEYTEMLVRESPSVADYLNLQHYDAELLDLESKYGLPDGRLYLARVDGAAAGCAALRKLDESRCELKRMYVRPQYRGKKISGALLDRLLADAHEIGYQKMLLDTLPFLTTAITMYRRRGFQEIPCYNDSPVPETIYMEREL
ncbi:GNAT family N-acetyltransferase [Oscillibacter sp.]|uniref:GNAT family N-acetyltransferase n=1 Tax=Oscillibacter sp. TaxID=1945593 RepID=UPI0028B02885|nr:GNAT family N-acetyltransferase [Oscillibacter sp.]